MSGTTTMADVLKAAVLTTNPTDKKAVLTTTAGVLERIAANVLSVDFARKNAGGAAVLSVGLNLVLAVDRANPSSMLIYLAWRVAGQQPVTRTVYSNVLTVGISNNVGTVVVNGGEDVVQYSLRLGDLT